MKTINIMVSGILIAGLCAGQTAIAAGNSQAFSPIAPSSTAKPDNYIGGSIGTSNSDGFCTTLGNCDADGKSWKLYSGIRVNDSVLFEMGYANLGEQQGQDTNGAVSQKSTAVTATGLMTYSVNEQVELFGKAGLARWSNTYTDSTGSSKSSGNDILVGAGANYDLGDNMGVRAEWERFKDIGSSTHKGDVDLLSVGVTFSSL